VGAERSLMARWIIMKRRQGLVTCFALLSLGVLSGCGGDTYPEDLQYPVRTDPLVTTYPTIQPLDFEKPGTFLTALENPTNRIFEDKEFEKKTPTLILFPLPVTLDLPNRKKPFESKGLKDRDRDRIARGLEDLFGTPANPIVRTGKKGISATISRRLRISDKDLINGKPILVEGSRLYRLHCLHCHGLSGDGRGPTAPWVDPHPRDYRQGIFKFTSSSQDLGVRKPLRTDLLRTLRQGILGTSMPSFGLLSDRELEALASYVIHLSIRGQTEFLVMQDILKGELEGKIETALRQKLRFVVSNWTEANEKDKGEYVNQIRPKSPYPYKTGKGRDILPGGSDYQDPDEDLLKQSVRRGHDLFKDPSRGGCIGCHYDYGRQSPYYFDAWGTVVRPIDLTRPRYRGGRRPIDFFWRIHSGINGSGMAPLAKLAGESDQDREKRIWDLVNFIQVLPYPEMRKRFEVDID
jgi:mono/diheme cytochrome c family protein